MTAKQKAFADYYLTNGNAVESYRLAYNPPSDNTAIGQAHKTLMHPEVQEYINASVAGKDHERIADQEEVLEYLTDAMRGLLDEEIAIVESTGDFKSQARKILVKICPRDRTRAAELLAKRYGLLNENVNLNGVIGVNIIDNIEDE